MGSRVSNINRLGPKFGSGPSEVTGSKVGNESTTLVMHYY